MLSILTDLTSFGAAGLMGAMWLCERKLNRTREQQILEAHNRILRDEQRLHCLGDVVDKTTSAIVRFAAGQQQQNDILKSLLKELRHARHS